MSDRATGLHLRDVQDQIALTLNPPARPSASSTRGGGSGRGLDDIDLVGGVVDPWSGLADDGESCWPDYAIRVDRR